jgi:hypothetical protein
MTTNLPKAVLEATDVSAITQLILRERESRDLARWDALRACFFADSVVHVSWFRGSGSDFVDGSIDMFRRGVAAKHRLSPILVTLADKRAIASMSAIIDLPAQLKGIEMNLSTYSRFLYRVERRDEKWGIVSFDAVYMRDELLPAIPGRSISIDMDEVRSFRPSYRMLSYYLATQGYAVDSNLPGEDRPELVDELYRELFDWAGIRR